MSDTATTASQRTTVHTTESNASGGGSDDTSTRKPMKNHSRERMKAEASFLRTRVQELEHELSQLLAKKALERCQKPSPVWRSLAKRQEARREKAEEERNRLRARLLHQLQVAKGLETIFRNRSGEFFDDLYANAATHGYQAYPVDNLGLLHDQFMDEIDQLYPLVDTLFAETMVPQHGVDLSLRRSSVVSQQINGVEKLYVELTNALYIPFPFERVCHAMWKAITTEYGRQQRLVEEYRCTEEEYSCNFFSQNTAPGCGHHFMAAIVMRKFKEDNRMVLVWRSVNWDQLPSASREFGDENGWITVQPVVDSITGQFQSEGTIVRVCTRYVPILEVQATLLEAGVVQGHSTSEPSSLIGEVTNRILNGTEEDIAAITESLENILLDESIGTTEDTLGSMIDELDEHIHDHEVSVEDLLDFPHK